MGLLDFIKKTPNSKSVAKDRLKLVLVHDRVNCSTTLLEMIEKDIIKVISNYMEIDEEGMDISISKQEIENSEGSVPVLFANIPIKNIRRGSDG
jgi:cell division topological specificity factor